MAGHLVVVGSLNMDLVVRSPRHPQPGETLLGTEFHTFPGGKGANQAVAAARLGGQVKMIGCVGADAFGDALLQTLSKDGVDTRHIARLQKAPTGVALITVDAAGQNTIVVVPGANGELSPPDLLAAEPAFEGASVVVIQLEIPLLAVALAVDQAHRHGARVVLNPAPAQPLGTVLVEQIDVLIPNQPEAALLSGAASAGESARRLRAAGVRSVIVTMGEDGVLVAEGEMETHLPAHRVSVVDTTAAGDAFVGAFAVALSEGCLTREAATWANAAGALAVTRAGAQPSLPTRAELEQFLTYRRGDLAKSPQPMV
jgi:ribokinase